MRRALNENQLLQFALIGLLAVAVIFMLYTRVFNRNDEAPPPADPAATAPAETAEASTTPPPTDDSAAAPETESATEVPSTEPAPTDPAAPGTDPAAVAAAAGEFVAGPGLPADVVQAHARDQVVALLIVQPTGIDDQKVAATVAQLGARGDTEVFVTSAARIADYSRIARGVDIDRVPALVVIKPRSLTEGPIPEATVSYGFRGPQSVEQAVRDALYTGREDIPYYPE